MKRRVFFLVLAAAALAGQAQQPAHAPVTVDTRAECVALGGAWLASRDTWRAVCQVPWGREDCLQLGGGWTPNAGVPGGGYCTSQVSERATQRQCAESGGTWGPPGSQMPFCQPNAQARAKVPLRKASDAGKSCEGQADCLYGCVYHGAPAAVGETVKGQCRATNQVEGCDSMVERGRLVGSICKR